MCCKASCKDKACAAKSDPAAWTWLQVAMASQGEGDANLGRRQACQFFFHYELPKIGAWLNVVNSRDSTCAHMPEAAF